MNKIVTLFSREYTPMNANYFLTQRLNEHNEAMITKSC